MRVTLEDGTHVDTDERHEWVVHTRESRKRTWKQATTVEARELRERLTVPNGSNTDGAPRLTLNFTVDRPEPIELPEADLLICTTLVIPMAR